MINVLVYNEATDRIERYPLNLTDSMPYVSSGSLTVGEFRARSTSNIIWTDRRTMVAWNTTRAAWGRPIYIGYAFRRIGEGGHADQSQHYAGTAFDVAQNLSSEDRNLLRQTAQDTGLWTYVEPAYLTPTWVHFDNRINPPACDAGFPVVRHGSRGVYVCTLQDALGTAGIPDIGIDGIFGDLTYQAVVSFQAENGLTADGIVGCATWTLLTAQTNGFYRRTQQIPLRYSAE